MNHPIESMSDMEKLEMEADWLSLVEEMNLENTLGPKGFVFSHFMFIEAYSRGYGKGQNK